ncbi:MAG: dihydropteroate synthase, partial [Chloroflexi bacterium]|nr:dihydropteroate synthase [Chloroflexota bacterium]
PERPGLDGSRKVQGAVELALRMEDEGADIIDVGGESSRPRGVYHDAKPVSADEEIARVVPVISALVARLGVPISIDSRKAAVAAAAIEAGAVLANDVSLLGDPDMAGVLAGHGVAAVVSHIRPGGHKGDVVADVLDDLRTMIDALVDAGVDRSSVIADPGIGFAKTAPQSVELMRNISRLRKELSLPILVGSSRKSFIGAVTGEAVEDRRFGTAATVALAVQGGADIVRVHDVKDMASVAKMSDAIVRGWDA